MTDKGPIHNDAQFNYGVSTELFKAVFPDLALMDKTNHTS